MYSLGKKKFNTKKEIKQFLKDFKDNNSVGTSLPEPYHSVMFELLTWHPSFDEWNYNVMDKESLTFKIMIDKKYQRQKAFSVSDSERTWAFSYLKCIRAGTKEANKKSNVIMAARESIKSQIYGYKDSMELESGLYKCAIDGKMYDRSNIHVDHNYEIITFKKILEDFLTLKEMNYSTVPLTRDKFEYSCFFPDIDQEWKDYHRENAILRCIQKGYNLSGKKA